MNIKHDKIADCSDVLLRPRVNHLLKNGLNSNVLTVIAGIGYGKTQAVLSFLNDLDANLIWIPLSSIDCVPKNFWKSFIKGVKIDFPKLASKLKEINMPSSSEEIEQVLCFFDEELSTGTKTVLAIDDYDFAIENIEISNFVNSLVQANYKNFSIILISNKRQPLIYQTIKSGNRHFSLTTEDLKFTRLEVHELFSFNNECELSSLELDLLIEETDSWPLALNTIRMQNFKNPDYKTEDIKDFVAYIRKSVSILLDFFEFEYFKNYSNAFRSLLIKLSFLPSFSISAIQKIDNSDIQELTTMLQDHMFIEFDQAEQLFTFQGVYKEFLQTKKYLISQEVLSETYKIWGDWTFEQGMYFDAVKNYMNCGFYEEMLQAIFKAIPLQNMKTSHYLIKALQSIPEDKCDQSLINFCSAFQYINQSELVTASHILNISLEKLEREQPTSDILGEVYSALAYIAFFSKSKSFAEYLIKASKLLKKGSRYINAKILFFDYNDLFFLPENANMKVDEMVKTIFDVYKPIEIVGSKTMQGFECLFAAQGMFMSYRLTEAEQYCHQALYKASETQQHHITVSSYNILMRVSLLQGDYKKATVFKKQLKEYVDQNQLESQYTVMETAHIVFYMVVGDMNRLRKLIEKRTKYIMTHSTKKTILQKHAESFENKIFSCLHLILKSEYREALAILQYMSDSANDFSGWSKQIYRYILVSVCYAKTGQKNKCIEAFKAAYSISHKNNIITPFIEFGKLSNVFLDEIKQYVNFNKDFDLKWIEALKRESAKVVKHHNTIASRYNVENKRVTSSGVNLTERETMVLSLLTKGKRRDQIAAEMNISINGVKKHLTKIYNKIGAVNKADATNIAISEGYVKPEW